MSGSTQTLRRDSSPAKKRSLSELRSHPLFLPVVIIVIGLLVLTYPVASSLYNNHRQIEAAKNYTDVVQQVDPSKRLAQLAAAARYNEQKPQGPLLDPWLERFIPDNQAYQDYLHQLNASETMGRIKIPTIDVDLPIYHGTSEKVLAKGVGHLFGSSLPIGGEGTHAVLTGHTGLSTATLFDNLTKLQLHDSFYVEVLGERHKYEIHQIDTVLPQETEGLAPVPGEDLVTLITCTPYGQNTHRLLVTGHQVPLEHHESEKVFDKTPSIWTWWMKIVAGIVVACSLILILWLRRQAKRSKHPQAGLG